MATLSSTVTPILKYWNQEEKFSSVAKARSSNDGSFLALNVENNILVVAHCRCSKEDVLSTETNNFVWGASSLHSDRVLDSPTQSQFLYIVDHELNITVFELNISKDTLNYSIVTLIGSSFLLATKDIPELGDLSLVSASVDSQGETHSVICLVNKQYIAQIMISKTNEPFVKEMMQVCKEDVLGSNDVTHVKRVEDIIFCISEQLVLYAIAAQTLEVVLQMNLQDKLLLYDVQHLDATFDSTQFKLVLIDESLQIHSIHIHKSLLLGNSPDSSNKKWPNIWSYRVGHMSDSKKIGKRRRKMKHTSIEVSTTPAEESMRDLTCDNLVASNTSIMMILKPKNRHELEQENKQCLVYFNTMDNTFNSLDLDTETCLCYSNNPHFPTLLISIHSITIPTFNANQEQLIDTIIQYSGIDQAEVICKTNNWDQFSIPLHTLEVGLQHRQFETVAFFLKSREKVFTRYWRSVGELSSSFNAGGGGSSGGSPSKSFTSQRSYTENINSDEMVSAIEMLMKSLKSCSTGKHKQNFFESLLKLCLSYFNDLIQDGIFALEMESYHSKEDLPILRSNSTTSDPGEYGFNFLHNIPDAMKYITEKLIIIRKYLNIKTSRKANDGDVVDGIPKKQKLDQEESLEEMLLSGNISSLQKTLFTKSNVCNGSFESLLDYGVEVATKCLKQNQIDKAETVLLNLGLNPKKEIKKLYMITLERELRIKLYPYLKKEHLLTQDDQKDYEYLQELESIYVSEDYTVVLQNHNFKWNVEEKHDQNENQDNETQNSLAYSSLSLEHVSNLDQETKRQIIVEGHYITSALDSIKKEDGDQLWKYLLRHNHVSIMIDLLSGKCDQFISTDFPANLLSNEETLPTYTREVVINSLVRCGYYPKHLLVDLSLLMKYLCQNDCLFADQHPMVFYKHQLSDGERKELLKSFNQYFVKFCENNDLPLLLWKFVVHYNLDVEQIKLEGSIKSWIPFLLSFHHLVRTKDFTEKSIKKAFMDNANFTLASEVDDATEEGLNTIVQNNKALVALAIVLVCNKNMTEIHPENTNDSPFAIEKTLLQSALKAYPKVHDALYSYSNDLENKDVTMYRLLQDNTQLEIRHWFGWQSNNSLAIEDENTLSELPHFSNPFLSERYAVDVKLSYDYYLQQARPMHAFLVYMKNRTHTSESIDAVVSSVYRLAIENYDSAIISTSCILFMELIEGPYQILKVDVKAAVLISKYWSKRVSFEKKTNARDVKTLLIDLLLAKKSRENLITLVSHLEDCIEVAIHENKEIDRFSFEAICHWKIAIQFCRLHQLPLTTCFVKSCCQTDNWLPLFLFIQLYQIPPTQILEVMEECMSNNSLKEHLLAIVKKSREIADGKTEKKRKTSKVKKETQQNPNTLVEQKSKHVKKNYRAQFYSKLGTTGLPSSRGSVSENPRELATSPSDENMARITNHLPMTSTPKKDGGNGDNQGHGQKLQHDDDLQLLDDTHFQEMSEIPNSNNLVDLLLQCDDNNTPWRKLLAYSLAVFNPLLTVLAACYEEADCWECLCVWYVCSVNEEMRFKICSSILDIKDEDAILMLRNHRWSNEDLLTIVKCLLTEGVKYAKLICHGFIIFRKTDPLLYLVQFLEAYMFNREEKHTLSLLVDFQTEYKAYRNRNNVSKTFSTNHDSYYCENFAFSCITLLLEKSPSTLHSYKLLHYLADSKFGFMFERQVPNFQLCKQTADILYPTGVQFSVQRLCTTNIESFDQEVYALYERLLDSGAFDESYSFAKLHSLPESNITLQKLRHELKLLRNKECWVDLESRCNFWRYAHRTFTEMDCLPELSAQFFEEQSLPSTHEMLSFEERVQLLKLSIRWLKCCQNVDVHKVSQLERTIWLYKIKGVKQIQQTGQPLPTIILDEWKSDTIFSFQGNIDRKCSDVSYVKNLPVTELVQNEEMDRLFVNEKESLENSGEFVLKDVEEEKAFDWLVGNLLDDLHITEARKVTNYFQKTTTDLEIVLTAIQLAQGQIAVERCSDTIKSILAGTTSRHISVSGILERSGSFSRPESLTKHIRTSGASDVMVDFVFIEEVQNALEKLTLRVTHGKRCCQQVLICFKIANILSRSYEEIVSDDRMNVLKSVFESPFDQRRQLAKQFIKAFDLSIDEVSTFIADTVISWTRIICGEEELILEAVTLVTVEESRVPTNEDILSLVQLAENTSLLGTMLLEEAVNISNEVTSTSKIGKLSYQVELLVYAHYCFTITCDMEGIAGVLRTTQHCTKRLAKRNQYSLMVRLLTGIGRFREMFYVIETLYNQHHFEVLCRKGKGDVKENQLKMALLDFMKRYHPEDVENLNMISVGFGMYREAAEHLEKQGRKEIERIKHDLKSGASKEVSNTLEEIRKTFSYAAENYSKEECLYLEQSCTRLAHLAKLQIQLLPSGVQVLGLTKLQTQEFLNTHQDFVEALVVADCYDFRDPAIWSEPIYRMVVVKGNFNYLDQFQSFFQLSSTIIGNIALRFRSDRANQSPNNMKKLLTRLRDVRSKLKIARELNFTDVENKLLEGSSGVYLRDNTF